jgi:peroxiredoxin
MDSTERIAAPEWIVSDWLNSSKPLTIAGLRGKVVVAGAFQMLCPGCVSELIPQLRKAHELFKDMNVQVVGLHTVFEHHDAMQPVSLKAFLHENRIAFPVGIDTSQMPGNAIPATMELYGMRGTPTILLIDREGNLRRHSFGHADDMQFGAEVMGLVRED